MRSLKCCLFILLFLSLHVSMALASERESISIQETHLSLVKPTGIELWAEMYSPPIRMSNTKINSTFALDIQGTGEKQLKNRKTFRWHRYIGYSVLVGVIANSITGNIILGKYQNNENPSKGLLYTHRALGITTGLLGISNGYLGSINYKKLKDEKVGLKKRKTHRILSTIASTGFLITTILGVRTYLEYKDAENPKDVEISKIHRAVARTTTGFTIATVVVIIW